MGLMQAERGKGFFSSTGMLALYALALCLAFAANFILQTQPAEPTMPFSLARAVCNIAALVFCALYSYYRATSIRLIGLAVALFTVFELLSQMFVQNCPTVVAGAIDGVMNGLEIVAVGLIIYRLPFRFVRSGIVSGFALSSFLVAFSRPLTLLDDSQLKSAMLLLFAIVFIGLTFAWSGSGKSSDAAVRDTVSKYGGPWRFFALMGAQQSASLHMAIVSTLLAFVLGMVTNYAALNGCATGFDGSMLIITGLLLALIAVASFLFKEDAWFPRLFTILMLASIVGLAVVLFVPTMVSTVGSSFSFMTMLMMMAVCSFTLEMAKEQGVTPAFACVTLPLAVNCMFDAGGLLNQAYYWAVSSEVYDISHIAAASLAVISVVLVLVLVWVVARQDDREYSLGDSARDANEEQKWALDGACGQSRKASCSQVGIDSDDRAKGLVESFEKGPSVEEILMSSRGLTQREAEMAVLFATGRSARFIAQQQVVAESTVKTHLKHAYVKLGVHNRQELIDELSLASKCDCACGQGER